ncbi:iron ABC transporter permease [Loktanella sp. SALINAS62]|uniref:ABC transporter permease n=1 Tax=Loktanella sp. SALINAS62 TaxID=2706124 RepID=UPI001B8D8CED|nr:iron ABC transporter permease [Loktanella sp. SALINAS62]MBS1302955.1 iron ABC transporter permease [Loktanella sp. SALINAS62]
MNRDNRRLDVLFIAALICFAVLPWYRLRGGFFTLDWVGSYLSDDRTWPGLTQLDQWWLWPVPLLIAIAAILRFTRPAGQRGGWLALTGAAGITWMVIQGLSVGLRGWNWGALEMLGDVAGQQAFGAGAVGILLCFAAMIAFGLAERGALKGDAFVIGSITLLILLVTLFVFYPLLSMFTGAFQDYDGSFTAAGVARNIGDPNIWSLGCVTGTGGCGVAWRTFFLAICTATGTTFLGLAFALVATRMRLPFKKSIRLLTVLPIITPPFVIGLALTLMLGRAGFVTEFIEDTTGWELGRWIYGLTGIWVAQMLSFTPIAFLILIGVVEGVSPAMEEASQTMRATRWRTFRRVSLPLMAPGIANAFLISFIESMADFGNPLVLGGNGGVLSTEIFFAVVGAQHDPSRAAVLATVLLGFTLSAFLAQRLWLGRRNFATVSGKGDGGNHAALPRRLAWPMTAIVVLWAAFTVFVYGMILFGGFVKTWGLDHTLTLEHYARAFSVTFDGGIAWTGIAWTGVAWNSFWTTMEIALIAAPLTAAVGLLTAWLIVRQRFPGRGIFEFALMMSFAIPGTVIGISYIMAFNLPPIQMTGTALILIFCFVFRNMPVGVRGGIAAMAQLDGSLDEASLTLGASSPRTLRKVILPLLRPAILAALVYSFVRAITSISAVIFLVSAKYNLATAYIVGLVENGEYGIAIAYSSVLIVVMITVIGTFQLLVGERRLRRRIEPIPKIKPREVPT